jgi:inorganic pyrophosphatase
MDSFWGTLTEEEDSVDCYLITGEPQTAGSTVQCEPVGLLEFFEGDETDHKVLAVPANSREEKKVTVRWKTPRRTRTTASRGTK